MSLYESFLLYGIHRDFGDYRTHEAVEVGVFKDRSFSMSTTDLLYIYILSGIACRYAKFNNAPGIHFWLERKKYWIMNLYIGRYRSKHTEG